MNNFRLSPLLGCKPVNKKKYIPWLWIFIVIETLVAGCWIFRLQEKIDCLESQVREPHKGENTNV